MRTLSHILVSIVVLLAPELASAETLYGSVVTVAGYYPTGSDRQTNFATASIGDGIEFSPDALVYFEGGTSGASMDLGASSIEIVSTNSSGTVHDYEFDGFIFSFAGAPEILNVTVNPQSSIVPSEITFTSGLISLNFQGVPHPVGARALLDIALLPVPEPRSSVLLAIGGLMLVTRLISTSRNKN